MIEFDGLLIGVFAYWGARFSGESDHSDARLVGAEVQIDVNGDGAGDILITLRGLTNTGQLNAMDFV